MNYETWLKATAPSYMRDVYGQAWLGGIGAALDDYKQEYVDGTLASFPEYAPTDALVIIGDEMGIPRGPSETDAQYETRLKHAWITWKYAGTGYSLLTAFLNAGFSDFVLAQTNGRLLNLDGSGSLVVTATGVNPNISGTPPWWMMTATDLDANGHQFTSRFWVISPTLNPNANQLSTIKSIITKWKPAKATCMGIVAILSGRLLGFPVRTLGSGTLVGTSTIYSYP